MELNILVKKTGRVVNLGETESLPAATIAYLLQYGATQSLNDAHASIVKKGFTGTDAEFTAKVDKEVDDWVVRARAGHLAMRAVAVDPRVAQMRAKAIELGLDPNSSLDAILTAMSGQQAPAPRAKRA